MAAVEHPLVAARRRAEAFHVLYWIDHDGEQFVMTVGEPNPGGYGIDNLRHLCTSLDDAQDRACESHGARWNHADPPRPAMKFHYTEAAKIAAGLAV